MPHTTRHTHPAPFLIPTYTAPPADDTPAWAGGSLVKPRHDLSASAITSIERLLSAIDTDPGAPLTHNEMARIALYTKWHLCRLFRTYTEHLRPPMLAAYGMSLHDYVTAIRLDYAKKLLTTTSLNYTEISCTVGYSSLGAFYVRFLTDTGVAPAHHRGIPSTGPTMRIPVRVSDDGTRMDAYDLRPDHHPHAMVVASAKAIDNTRWVLVGAETAEPYGSTSAAKQALKRRARALLTAADEDSAA